MQLAMAHANPFGERRDDLRHAFNTAHLLMAQRTEKMSADEFVVLVNHLADYSKPAEQTDSEANIDALNLMLAEQAKAKT